MREIFFNSFKERILRGEVDSHIEASGIPMSDLFLDTYDTDEISIEQYRNLDDFYKFSRGNNTVSFESTKFNYDTYGVDYQNYYEDDLSEKPIFVNRDNAEKFLQVYSGELLYSDPYVKSKIDSYLASDDININYGFYYVTKKSHLNWIAKRVNDDYNFNNRIVIVLGDDIGTSNEVSGTAYESVIGSNPNKPFQGIFDLNGHAVNNLNLKCKKNSNGIIGYLGTDGIVRDGVVLNPKFTGMNKISLEKIKNDCSDVVCGTLVGTNYGTVENIVTSGTMDILDGFCPEVYVAGNKAEYQQGMNTYEENNYTNAFFPNKFCINSIYNVIPYVGYFCEGADSYFNDVGDPLISSTLSDVKERWLNLTSANVNSHIGMDFKNDKALGMLEPTKQYNLDHYLEGKLSNSSHCDLSSVELTRVIPDALIPTSGHGYSWDINNTNAFQTTTLLPDVIWFGFWNKKSTGNTYLADIYRWQTLSTQFGSSYYLRPLITMGNDQMITDKLMKNTVKSIGSFVDYVGDEQYDGLDEELDYIYEYSDYAANLAHQIRDQIVMFYDGSNVAYEGEGNCHVTTHQKMNPYSRISYYLSPIVGNNFGTIKNIDCRHSIKESKYTFVGFIGNVCGKENCGDISNCQVDLDVYADSQNSDLLASRDYTDTNRYMPDYASLNSGYNNLLNFFGYNYDYFQTSGGLAESDLDEYASVSADCVKVSKHFYEYHNLCYSGVQEKFLESFIFNKCQNGDKSNLSNFRIYESSKASEIGSEIPQDIRKAKMKFTFMAETSSETTDKFEIVVKYLKKTEGIPYRATYKFYNPYHKKYSDNIHRELQKLGSDIQIKLESTVDHMDLNYLGDAAKCVMSSDTWLSQNSEFEKRDGSMYKPTANDILNNCSAFNGSLGKTVDNARLFCRNMMDAKVAVGYDMLGNQTLDVSYRYPSYRNPFGGNNDYFFGSTNYGLNVVIPAGSGPNDSDEDWELNSNQTDIEYFMGPAPDKYKSDGPVAFSPGVKPEGLGNVLNTNADNPGTFCSVQPYGLWDLHGVPEEDGSELFDAIKNSSRSSITRSMLSITLRDGSALAKKLISFILENDEYVNQIITANPSHGTSGEYRYDLNKIFIPISNRTQHEAYQSSSFEGLSDVSGVYLTEYGRNPVYTDNMSSVRDYTDSDIGNLDLMYIDMALSVPVSGYPTESGREAEYSDLQTTRYESYPIIIQMPIQKLLVPISAVKQTAPIQNVVTGEVTNDRMTDYLHGAKTVKVRGVNFYHLTPAYDLSDHSNSIINYKLKSIYNIGGIAGMINHSERYIQTENNRAGAGQNYAECGSISNCKVNITQRTNQYVQDLQSTIAVSRDRQLEDADQRSIGITNKIGGVAAIYEYRQNDMGTSPYCKDIEASTDALMRFRFQPFKFTNISIGGEENIYGYSNYQKNPSDPNYVALKSYLDRRVNRRIFSPFIEWANISNMLDTTNFFGYKECYSLYERYLAHHSSNFPIDGNPVLYTSWMEAYGDTADIETTPKPLVPQIDMTMLASAYPIANSALNGGDDWQGNTTLSSQAYMETMNRFGSTSASQDFSPAWINGYGGTWKVYPRIGMHKRYDWIPGFLMQCRDIYLYGTTYWDKIDLSMSPMSNAPCSDYNDIYLQMFSGNPNFVNRKLSKPILNAEIGVIFGAGQAQWRNTYEGLVTRTAANKTIEIYDRRGAEQKYRDKYFTWDYETSGTVRDPLNFDILYRKPKRHARGLWIHQNGLYDEYEVLRYAMKGGDYGKNDGACLHLGYLPSDKAIVELLNYDSFNTEEMPRDSQGNVNQYEEGHAISGYGFNGMLLIDAETRDLICYLDTENSRDFDLGCWVAPLSEKAEIENRKYGLLTEIVAENSPTIEQDPSDTTQVEPVENVVYVDNTPRSI